jgi:hypothetical protein
MNREDIQVIGADAHHCSATWRNVIVTVWRKETMVEAVQRMERAVLQLIQTYPKGVGMLILVEQHASMPSDEAREAIASLIRKMDQRLVGCGYVFEGDGFASAAVRYVIIGLTMLARPSYDYTIVKSVPEVSAWLSKRLRRTDTGASADEVGHTIERIRAIVGGAVAAKAL